MSRPLWTILVATLGRRSEQFTQLMGSLLPQCEPYGGAVTVEALWNNGERPLGVVWQGMLESARSVFTSFVDDDDRVAPDYVAEIMPLLGENTEVVGFLTEVTVDGERLPVCDTRLSYGAWSNDGDLLRRDVTQRSPILRELAIAGDYAAGPWPEDGWWAERMRGRLSRELRVDKVLYFYDCVSAESAGRLSGSGFDAGKGFVRPEIVHPLFSWQEAP